MIFEYSCGVFEDFDKLDYLHNEIDNLISKSKKEYYQNINRKLIDLLTSSKTYWSLMKTFFNSKKVPVIPLLFNGAFVTDFQEKAKIFNSFFAKQCTLVSINILVRMIKLCINSVADPLTLIFQNSMAAGTFATQWKRANIVSIQKRNDKQIVSNCQSVSLLPISVKFLKS